MGRDEDSTAQPLCNSFGIQRASHMQLHCHPYSNPVRYVNIPIPILQMEVLGGGGAEYAKRPDAHTRTSQNLPFLRILDGWPFEAAAIYGPAVTGGRSDSPIFSSFSEGASRLSVPVLF